MLSRATTCGCKSELAKADFAEVRLSAPDPKPAPALPISPTGRWFHDKLRRVVGESALTWLDVQSRNDVMSFYPFDQAAGHGKKRHKTVTGPLSSFSVSCRRSWKAYAKLAPPFMPSLEILAPAQRYFKIWDVCLGGLAPRKSGERGRCPKVPPL